MRRRKFTGATRLENNPVWLFLIKAVSKIACEQGKILAINKPLVSHNNCNMQNSPMSVFDIGEGSNREKTPVSYLDEKK